LTEIHKFLPQKGRKNTRGHIGSLAKLKFAAFFECLQSQFASRQNLFKTWDELLSFERAGEGNSLPNKFLLVLLVGEQTIWLWQETSSRSSNFAPEMSFPVAVFWFPQQVPQRAHALPQALPVIKKYFSPFCSP